MNFADKPGPAGSLPTPEVAQSLPTRSADGKTYTFTIRAGFRFSPPSSAVTAQSFKDSIERAFNPKIKGWSVDFNDIAGVRAYEAGSRPADALPLSHLPRPKLVVPRTMDSLLMALAG